MCVYKTSLVILVYKKIIYENIVHCNYIQWITTLLCLQKGWMNVCKNDRGNQYIYREQWILIQKGTEVYFEITKTYRNVENTEWKIKSGICLVARQSNK